MDGEIVSLSRMMRQDVARKFGASPDPNALLCF
jgi:hypothetical protein